MPPWRRVAPLECSDGNQTEIRHELAGISEAGDVTEFGDHRRRRDQSHPAQCLQGAHHRGKRPIRQRLRRYGSAKRSRRTVAASTAAMQSSSTMMRRLLSNLSPAIQRRCINVHVGRL